MKTLTKLLAIFSAAAMLLSFAACSKNSTDTPAETSSVEDIFTEPATEYIEEVTEEALPYTGYSSEDLRLWGRTGEYKDMGIIGEYSDNFMYMLGTDGILYKTETGENAVRKDSTNGIETMGYRFYYDENETLQKEALPEPYDNQVPEDHQVFYKFEVDQKEHLLVRATDGSIYVIKLDGENSTRTPLKALYSLGYNKDKIYYSTLDEINHGETYIGDQHKYYIENDGIKFCNGNHVTYNHDRTEFTFTLTALEDDVDEMFCYKNYKLYSKKGDSTHLYSNTSNMLSSTEVVATTLPEGYTTDQITKVYEGNCSVFVFDDNSVYYGSYNESEGTMKLTYSPTLTMLYKENRIVRIYNDPRTTNVMILADDNCVYTFDINYTIAQNSGN